MKEVHQDLEDYRKRFDRMYELGYDSCWYDDEIPSEIADYVQFLISNNLLDIKTSEILDLGCGRGQLLRYLEQGGFRQIIGVDISEVATQFSSSHTVESHIIVADAIKGLPFKTNTFSLVTELTVLSSLNPQHWPTILNEIYRVLERGGSYISEVFSREQKSDQNRPLVTKSPIPWELDQVYGVTAEELVNIFGRTFSINQYRPFNPRLSDSFYVLAQKI